LDNDRKGKLIEQAKIKRNELEQLFEAVLPACLYVFGLESHLDELAIEDIISPPEEHEPKELYNLSIERFKDYFKPKILSN
jgi:hypothetical protein